MRPILRRAALATTFIAAAFLAAAWLHDQYFARPQWSEAHLRAAVAARRGQRTRDQVQPLAALLFPDGIPANVVQPVPESLRAAAFYRKYADAGGIPVLASDKVPDAALIVARDIVRSMLAGRPDLARTLVVRRWSTGVLAETEMTMDIPEYRHMKRPGVLPVLPSNQLDRDYWAFRARGMGAPITTGAEENLLGYPQTPYYGENIFVHEFAHAIMDGAIRDGDPALFAAVESAYRASYAAGKYTSSRTQRHYAMTNASEYWAEGVQWWFFSNYGEQFADGTVETPEELAAYDPALNALLARVFSTHRIPADVFYGRRIRP